MALIEELRRIIALEGPISVERYMALCLSHPTLGYYATRDPLGAGGDFTTAPEISQVFGELIGLWAAQLWLDMGSPAPLSLVELGPGRGTLMADMLRAGRAAPGFVEAAQVHLVETSPTLRAIQRERLAGSAVPVTWHAALEEVPAGPAVIIANEFFDALPIRQYVRSEDGWRERLIGLNAVGGLMFGLASEPDPRIRIGGAAGSVLEYPALGLALMQGLAERLVRNGGAALIIDYGGGGSPLGDTLQAVSRHAYADPLAAPGEADLTTHVRFDLLAGAAERAGALVHGPVGQGDFLRAVGIEARSRALRARASERQAADLDAAVKRLTGDGPNEMGGLFKAMAITSPSGLRIAGFAAAYAEASGSAAC